MFGVASLTRQVYISCVRPAKLCRVQLSRRYQSANHQLIDCHQGWHQRRRCWHGRRWRCGAGVLLPPQPLPRRALPPCRHARPSSRCG